MVFSLWGRPEPRALTGILVKLAYGECEGMDRGCFINPKGALATGLTLGAYGHVDVHSGTFYRCFDGDCILGEDASEPGDPPEPRPLRQLEPRKVLVAGACGGLVARSVGAGAGAGMVALPVHLEGEISIVSAKEQDFILFYNDLEIEALDLGQDGADFLNYMTRLAETRRDPPLKYRPVVTKVGRCRQYSAVVVDTESSLAGSSIRVMGDLAEGRLIMERGSCRWRRITPGKPADAGTAADASSPADVLFYHLHWVNPKTERVEEVTLNTPTVVKKTLGIPHTTFDPRADDPRATALAFRGDPGRTEWTPIEGTELEAAFYERYY